MPSVSRTPTLLEVLNALRSGIMRDLRVSLPGRVEAFDADTCTADVQPLVKETAENDDGSTSQVSLPVLTGVPIIFPGGGGLRITFPIAKGDTVLLVFTDRSIDAWLSNGNEGAPDDQRRHSLTDAVAYPGIMPGNAPWKNIEDGVITAGLDSASSSDFVALAAKVKTELDSLRDAHNALKDKYNAHTHNGGPAGVPPGTMAGAGSGTVTISGATSAPLTTDAGADAPAVGEVKSDTFKVRG